MKRELFSFSSFLSLLLSVLLFVPTFGVGAAANATATVSEEKTLVYVSQNGSDASDGTKETPFLTLSAAVRALNGKDGTVVLLDTAFWSQNKKTPLVPNHTGVVTFRGETRDAVLDFSAQSEKSADAADMLLSGDTVLENLTLRTHFNKSLFTNGHDLTLSGITYRSGEKEAPFDLVIGRYSAVCAGSRVVFAFDRVEALGELRDFRIAGSNLIARLPAHLLTRKRHRLFALLNEEFLAALDFPIELRVAHLLHDVRKARLVHLKHRPTMRTLNLVHRNLPVLSFAQYITLDTTTSLRKPNL